MQNGILPRPGALRPERRPLAARNVAQVMELLHLVVGSDVPKAALPFPRALKRLAGSVSDIFAELPAVLCSTVVPVSKVRRLSQVTLMCWRQDVAPSCRVCKRPRYKTPHAFAARQIGHLVQIAVSGRGKAHLAAARASLYLRSTLATPDGDDAAAEPSGRHTVTFQFASATRSGAHADGVVQLRLAYGVDEPRLHSVSGAVLRACEEERGSVVDAHAFQECVPIRVDLPIVVMCAVRKPIHYAATARSEPERWWRFDRNPAGLPVCANVCTLPQSHSAPGTRSACGSSQGLDSATDKDGCGSGRIGPVCQQLWGGCSRKHHACSRTLCGSQAGRLERGHPDRMRAGALQPFKVLFEPRACLPTADSLAHARLQVSSTTSASDPARHAPWQTRRCTPPLCRR